MTTTQINVTAEVSAEILTPELIIRAPTSEEEMKYLWLILEQVPILSEKGYLFVLPEHEVFQKLARNAPNFGVEDRKVANKVFVDEVFDPEFYKKGLARLKDEKTLIEKALPGMIEFNKVWGFRLFSKYQFILTRYGPGGMCNDETGKVIIMVKKDGTFKRHHPSHTAIHEMVHIGIERLIADRFGLTYKEKERLVDLIVNKKFGSFLSGYQMQNIGDSRIDPYITEEALVDLPNVIENYIKDFPRK